MSPGITMDLGHVSAMRNWMIAREVADGVEFLRVLHTKSYFR